MANEKNNRKNTKKRRNFKGRSDRFVEEFRWGFVHGEEPEDQSGDDIPEKIPAASKPEKGKKNNAAADVIPPVISKSAPAKKEKNQPVRKQVQPKTISRSEKQDDTGVFPADNFSADNFPADNFSDEDLNLPSYGRTPVVPLPAELQPEKPVKFRQPQNTQFRQNTQFKETPQKVRQKPEKNSAAVQLPYHKEQMVWDSEKRDYVPLTVSKKQPEPAAVVDRHVNRPAKQTAEPYVKQTSKQTAKQGVKPAVKDIPVKDMPAKSVPAKNISSRDIPPRNISPRDIPSRDISARDKRRPDNDENRRQRRADIPPMSGSAVTGEKPDAGNIEVEASGFIKLGVSDTMLEALKLLRFVEPTPIQAGVFKQVKSGLDVMGQAQTGTGKTAAFCIPIIEAVEECPPGDAPVAAILVPTRELAVQVRDEALKLAYGRDIRITACYGGKPLAKQIERLKNGIDIIIGTPGRVLDLMNRRALFLDSLRWVVLDEADRMLDIGFRPDIEKILRRTPKERQTLLFSATLAPPVVRLAEKYMNEPVVLDFSNKNIAVETIEQFYITVDPQRKFDALVHLLKEQEPQQAIIFTRTKRGADRLARLLSHRFDTLAAIHGDLSQEVRDSVMLRFRSGKLRYLVATDVVGRGIDVSGISHIINYDIPAFCDDYVHRVGRTGRMGREGVAFTFVTVAEGSELTRIEMRIDKLLKRAELKGFDAFEKPVATQEELAAEDARAEAAEPPKPVFGKPVRKVRKAL